MLTVQCSLIIRICHSRDSVKWRTQRRQLSKYCPFSLFIQNRTFCDLRKTAFFQKPQNTQLCLYHMFVSSLSYQFTLISVPPAAIFSILYIIAHFNMIPLFFLNPVPCTFISIMGTKRRLHVATSFHIYGHSLQHSC